jgi:hypothetical protein
MIITKNLLANQEKKEEKDREKEWAHLIKSKDNYACAICGNSFKPNAHHIVPREHKDFKFAEDNGITLCTKHHKFSRIISAHNNPLAFFCWLQAFRSPLYLTARERTKKILAQEDIIL